MKNKSAKPAGKDDIVMALDRRPEAHIIDQKRLFDGYFKIDQITYTMDRQEGGTQTLVRLNFNRGHAAAILPYDPVTDKVVLVTELRPGLLAAGDYPYEEAMSAGMIDPGETPLQTMIRESKEEMGLDVKTVKVFHQGAYVSPGGTSERIALGIAIVDSSKIVNGSVHGKPEEGENIKTVVMSARKFIDKAMKGEIKDLKTLATAFWLAANRRQLRKEYPKPKKDGKAPKA